MTDFAFGISHDLLPDADLANGGTRSQEKAIADSIELGAIAHTNEERSRAGIFTKNYVSIPVSVYCVISLAFQLNVHIFWRYR